MANQKPSRPLRALVLALGVGAAVVAAQPAAAAPLAVAPVESVERLAGIGASHRYRRHRPSLGWLVHGVRTGRIACYRHGFGHRYGTYRRHYRHFGSRHPRAFGRVRIGAHTLVRLVRGGLGHTVRCYRVY